MNKGLWRSARLPFVLTFLMKTKLPCILTFLVNLGLWCLRCRVSSFATGGPWIGLSHQHAPRVPRLHPSQSPQAFLRGRAARWLLFGWIRVLGSSVKRVDRAESYRLPYVGLFYRWCIRDFLKKNKWKGNNNVATSNWTKRTSSVCHIQNGLAMQMWDPRLLHVKLSDQNYARRMLTTPDKHSLHIKYLEG